MGFIQNIKDWIEDRKSEKLIGEAIQKTQEAEKNPNKNALEEMLKLARENPEAVDKFIRKVVGNRNISDEHVGEFLQEAPINVARDAIKGIRNLDDEVNINKNHVSNVTEGIFKVAKKVEEAENVKDVNYAKVEETLENMTPSNMPKEQEKLVKEQREEFNTMKIEKATEELNEIYNRDLYTTNEVELYQGIKNAIESKRFKKMPKELKQKINQIIAKKKASEFKQNGTIMVKSDLKYIQPKPEELLKEDIPNLIEKEYKKLPINSNYDSKEFLENTYETPKLKIAVINQIMKKIASEIVKDNKKVIEPVMEYIKANNPDLSKEEINQIEENTVKEIVKGLESKGKERDIDEIKAKMNGTNKKQEIIKSIYNELNSLPKQEVEQTYELIKEAKKIGPKGLEQVTTILKEHNKENEKKDQEQER